LHKTCQNTELENVCFAFIAYVLCATDCTVLALQVVYMGVPPLVGLDSLVLKIRTAVNDKYDIKMRVILKTFLWENTNIVVTMIGLFFLSLSLSLFLFVLFCFASWVKGTKG
jgi:hypothetical protein